MSLKDFKTSFSKSSSLLPDKNLNLNGFLDISPALPAILKIRPEKFEDAEWDEVTKGEFAAEVISPTIFYSRDLENFVSSVNQKTSILKLGVDFNIIPNSISGMHNFPKFTLNFDLSKFSLNSGSLLQHLIWDFKHISNMINEKDCVSLLSSLHGQQCSFKTGDPISFSGSDVDNNLFNAHEWVLVNSSKTDDWHFMLILEILNYVSKHYYGQAFHTWKDFLEQNPLAIQYFNTFAQTYIDKFLYDPNQNLSPLLYTPNCDYASSITSPLPQKVEKKALNEFNWKHFLPAMCCSSYQTIMSNSKSSKFEPPISNEKMLEKMKSFFQTLLDFSTTVKKTKELKEYTAANTDHLYLNLKKTKNF